MTTLLQEIRQFLGQFPPGFALGGIGFGVFVIFLGLSAVFAGASPSTRRMRAALASGGAGADYDLILGHDNDPNGLLKAFVPTSRKERTSVARRMRQAGIQGSNAVVVYYLVRTILGIVLPALFIGVLLMPAELQATLHLDTMLGPVTFTAALQIATALVFTGFYGPTIWLRQRIRSRRRSIRESLPNALDLLQISVEAGLGLDAAIVRVSHELASAAPDISAEFMMLELEIQAGKERRKAFADMAARTGVDEVAAFANVIQQAAQFGTSISKALTTYADEIRLDRELQAQEKANRLPVQMSAVMALMMMPALLMICLTPMVIRWFTMFPAN